MRRMRLFALFAFVVACGGSPKPKTPPSPPPAPDPIPATAGPACSVVADKLAIVIHADKPDAQAGAKAELKARCTDEKWSDEARNCFATVDTDDELEGCKQHLSAESRAKFGGGPPAGAGAAAPAAAPAPPAAAPKKKRATRGPVKKGDSADPQEGGESSADPQEGGE